MVKIYHDQDADMGILAGKTVAVIGYGSQGTAQSQCMRDSGVNVIIGARKGPSFDRAVADGFLVLPIEEAVQKADIVHLLLPDELHEDVYNKQIAPYMKPGMTFSCSHGFNVVYKRVVPAEGIDVIMVAPKAPATEERKAFLSGFGVPGLVAVEQDASGHAFETAMAMAKAQGYTRAGVLRCTFQEETYEDLFGEQNVLCGGAVDLMRYGFEVLTEAGYPPEMAYFETVHEMKLIVDIIIEHGIAGMNKVISNTAEFGEYFNGPFILTPDVKERMKASLKRIESGEFAQAFLKECKEGYPTMKAKRAELDQHLVETTGAKIRSLFERKK